MGVAPAETAPGLAPGRLLLQPPVTAMENANCLRRVDSIHPVEW